MTGTTSEKQGSKGEGGYLREEETRARCDGGRGDPRSPNIYTIAGEKESRV
jgi:hypothetical protein